MNCCLHFQQMQFRRRFKIKRNEENRVVRPVVQTQKQFPGTKWLRLLSCNWHLPSQDGITRGVWLLWSLFPSRKLTSSAFPRPSFYTWQRTMKHTDIVQSCLASQIPDVKATCMIQRSTPKIERDLIRVPAQVLLVKTRAQNRQALRVRPGGSMENSRHPQQMHSVNQRATISKYRLSGSSG